MNKLEARILIEMSGNYYEEEIDEVMTIYEDVYKNIGFTDNRRDRRYIVKFHDIFYYMPDDYAQEHEAEVNYAFGAFCDYEYECIKECLEEEGIYIGDLLDQHSFVGHYQTFMMVIPEITKDNAVEVAMEIYNRMEEEGEKYASQYARVVDILQDLEDNYMEYWIQFIEDMEEEIPPKVVDEIKKKYHKDMERRKATYTSAK